MKREEFNKVMQASFGDRVVNIPSEKISVTQAKTCLLEAGYSVHTPWSIDDILERYDTTTKIAHKVLDQAISSDRITQEIFDEIDYQANQFKLKEKQL